MFSAILPFFLDDQAAVTLMKGVVERGPWMESMRKAQRRATAGDYAGALVLYARLAEVSEPSSGSGVQVMVYVCGCVCVCVLLVTHAVSGR